MAKKSIRERLEKLESECKFLDWFVSERFLATLTREELETWASGGNLPDPIPNRPSSLDTLDRKSLLKLWEEDELRFGGAVEKNWLSTPTRAFGQSREAGSIIRCRAENCSSNGETSPRRKASLLERQTEEDQASREWEAQEIKRLSELVEEKERQRQQAERQRQIAVAGKLAAQAELTRTQAAGSAPT